MQLRTQILTNTIGGWASRSLAIVVSLVVTPIVLMRLGTYEYGLWVTLGQSIGFFMLLDLGIANSVCRYISGIDSPESMGEKISVYSTAMTAFLGASAIIASLTIMIAPLVPVFLKLKAQYYFSSKLLFLVLGLHTAIVLPLRVARGLIQAQNQYYYIDIVTITTSLLRSLLIITAFFINRLDLFTLCFLSVICSIGSELALFHKAHKLYPGIKFNLPSVTVKRFSQIFSFGSSSLVQTLSGLMYSKGQTLLVGITLGMDAASIFHIPASLLMRIGPFIGRAGATFLPIVRKYENRKQSENIILLSIFGLRYSLIIGWGLAFYLLMFGNIIIHTWLNSSGMSAGEIEAIYTTLIIMIFPIVISRANKGNQAILRGVDQHWMVSNLQFTCAVLGLVTSYVFIRWFDLNIFGAAIGWSLTIALPQITIFQHAITKTYRYRLRDYLAKTYLPSLLSIIPAVVSVLFYQYWHHNRNVSHFSIGTAIYCLVAITGIFSIGIDKRHRDIFKFRWYK
jgi:O-antigen/teichoic acid export membrane protein